jgi:hypothetical protein
MGDVPCVMHEYLLKPNKHDTLGDTCWYFPGFVHLLCNQGTNAPLFACAALPMSAIKGLNVLLQREWITVCSFVQCVLPHPNNLNSNGILVSHPDQLG